MTIVQRAVPNLSAATDAGGRRPVRTRAKWREPSKPKANSLFDLLRTFRFSPRFFLLAFLRDFSPLPRSDVIFRAIVTGWRVSQNNGFSGFSLFCF
jgi:hypothetical protein